jgi:hypothetical protein
MRCIYADLDNPNKFNKGDSGLLAQMYLQLSKSGGTFSNNVEYVSASFNITNIRDFSSFWFYFLLPRSP